MRLVLLGCPGAGKGTQAKFITKEFHIPQISTGDILRNAVNAGTDLGKKVKQTMEEGKLVSDDIMIQLVKERLEALDCKSGFLLDGYPRTIPQAESLKQNNIDIDSVLELQVPDEELIKRLSGRRVHPSSGRIYHLEYNPPKNGERDDETNEPLVQRPDDQEDTVRHRLSVYHEQTKPLVSYYKNQKSTRFVPIDGTGSLEEVRNRILAVLE